MQGQGQTQPSPGRRRARRRWRRIKRRWAFQALVILVAVLAGVVVARLG